MMVLANTVLQAARRCGDTIDAAMRAAAVLARRHPAATLEGTALSVLCHGLVCDTAAPPLLGRAAVSHTSPGHNTVSADRADSSTASHVVAWMKTSPRRCMRCCLFQLRSHLLLLGANY
eukprot:NODE_4422_length_676_cov_2.750403.p1 GENE.NODE_4422_length_676_cov_2.750403~~NODE_4422_length_676_cov_2.750403.p1  ORF type:complete len:119 (-),score=2.76 NODE_4422_length_676_cov_2.750403:13-369(-)